LVRLPERQNHGRRVRRGVVHVLIGRPQGHGGGWRLAGAGVVGVAGEGAAGDLNPDSVAAAESVRGRPQLNVRTPDLIGAGQAD
jgi:hypothetical protein